MVIIQISATYTDSGDLTTLGRIFRGIEGLEKNGYTVERYEHYPKAGSAKKYIIAVERTEAANDADYRKWLDGLNSKYEKPADSGAE